MNIQQRLTALERQTLSPEPTGIPIKPNTDWTDGEHIAVVKGLGLMGANIMALTDAFIAKYQTYIDRIRADYNERGITPDKPLIMAKPLSYSEIIDIHKAKYFDD
jgi:hypothetical protein